MRISEYYKKLPLIERFVILENTLSVKDRSCRGDAINVIEVRWLE